MARKPKSLLSWAALDAPGWKPFIVFLGILVFGVILVMFFIILLASFPQILLLLIPGFIIFWCVVVYQVMQDHRDYVKHFED